MKIGSCFSGVGAMDLAAELWWGGETVWFCERDKYAAGVFRRHWLGVPVYGDVRTLVEDGAEPIDVLCGGPPCVDLSCAGRGAGLRAERSGLFFDFVAAAAALQPKWVFIENVPALLSKWRGTVEDALESAGYTSIVWAKVAAQHCGAPHKRARVFVLASREGRTWGVCDAGPLPPVGRWPTPRATEHKANGYQRKGDALFPTLTGAVGAAPRGPSQAVGWGAPTATQACGKLSPLWVETLQGLPVGWTDAEGESMRAEAMATAHAPPWPAPMVKGMWGDSPQFDHEPPRVVIGKLANWSARLRCLGNLNPPAQYLLAINLLHEGPRQQSLFSV